MQCFLRYTIAMQHRTRRQLPAGCVPSSVLHITACKRDPTAKLKQTCLAEEALARGTLEVSPDLLHKLRQLASSDASAADGNSPSPDSGGRAQSGHQPGQPSTSNGSSPASGPPSAARQISAHSLHQLHAGPMLLPAAAAS